MNSHLAKRKATDFLIVLLFLQLIVYITVFFDIPVARQVFGFIYFTFVPGFLVIKLLKSDELDRLETVLFSVGLSIAFLMIAGLLINEFGLMVGILHPLSSMSLTIISNNLILVGAVLVHLRNGSFKIWSGQFKKTSLFALLFLCLPILSIIGAMLMNTYGNNSMLFCMIIATSLLFLVGVIKFLPPRFYPLAVLMIAIALLFHSSLISNYIVHFGSDVSGEYFAFKNTERSLYWNLTNPYLGGEWVSYGRLNSMLSVTILPTMYSSLLNIDSTLVFKILFPLIFSLVPLGLYQLWQARFGKKYAFISAFLLMAQSTFYTEMLGLNRQIVAELFFVLLLLVTMNRRMKPVNRMMCFMIFSFALVTSHYAIGEIFLFLISFTLISLIVSKRSHGNITEGMVVFLFVVTFLWYIYTSNSAVFDSFLQFGDNLYRQLNTFFDPRSRGQTVLMGLGLEAAPSIWNTISRMFAYIIQALIIVGFLGLIKKRKKINLEVEYFILTLLALVLLAAVILVPGLAETLNMTRFYHILLFFLAPLCILGAETIINLIRKRNLQARTSVLILVVLIPYFLFQTNFVYEVTRSESWSISLSNYRMSPLRRYGRYGYLAASDVFGAQWLSNHVATGSTPTYSDYYARMSELRSYGLIYLGYIEILSNVTQVKPDGLVYLSSLNIIEGIIVGTPGSWNTSELHFLYDLSNIYSNGRVEILKNTP